MAMAGTSSGAASGRRTQRYRMDGCKVPGCDQYELPPGVFKRCHVCRAHATAPSVVLQEGAEPTRFCQLCHTFHPLTKYDGMQRSCREKLERHNKRRRDAKEAPSKAAKATRLPPKPVVPPAAPAAAQEDHSGLAFLSPSLSDHNHEVAGSGVACVPPAQPALNCEVAAVRNEVQAVLAGSSFATAEYDGSLLQDVGLRFHVDGVGPADFDQAALPLDIALFLADAELDPKP